MEPGTAEKLTNLASDAASIEKDGGGFMNPGEKRKRGPYKKRGQAGPENGVNQTRSTAKDQPSVASGPAIDPIKELKPLTATVVGMYSNVLQMYAEDERARPDDKTQDCMAEASAACLHQYFPDTFGKHAALILLATIVGTTSFNAWILRRENLEKLKRERRETEIKPPAMRMT